MKKPVADFWYGIDSCDDGIVHLRETWVDPYIVGDLWLVRGASRDLLVDTGTGMVSPQPIIRAITDRPVLAIALNCFYDHAGGLHCFEERGCHSRDAAAIESLTAQSSVVSSYVEERLFSAHPYPDFDAAAYRMRGAPASVRFEHGDTIDLGGRLLKVLATPGQTPGSICIWEERSGSLFTGDTLFDDPQERRFAPADPAAFAESLRMLLELPIKMVYGGHFGRVTRPRMQALIERYFEREAAHPRPENTAPKRRPVNLTD
jgi:glyoxylase-like metal-dependent hydrolase (beta-lactamase superfamily II)